MKTKIVPELFLEVAELKRFEKGLRDDGFVANKIADTQKWGIVENLAVDPAFNYFKIVKSGDVDKFRIKNGMGFDKDRLMFMYKYENEDILIPQQNQDYWVKISHRYESREDGLVKVGSTTNKSVVSGVSTKFTDVLRGQPNFPSKIKFLNSSMYNLEYEVLEVIDDNNILINGIFDVLEENLQYAVVGTFTPGAQPPAPNKQIFQYDSCQVVLMQDTGSFPVLVDGKEFIIGKVRYTVGSGGGTVIQDYRFTCIYTSIDKNHVDSISEGIDKLAGIESIKKFSLGSSLVYVCGIDWKFNIISEVQDNSLSVVSIANGKGGVWQSAAQFVDGDMDGWRYYYEDGNYSIILSSVKQGTQSILLYLDSVRIGSGAGKYITPNAEDIEIEAIVLNVPGNAVFSKNFFFSITQNHPTLQFSKDELLFTNQRIRLYYVLKNNFRRSQTRQFNQSTYFNPAAYNSQGVLVDQTQTTTEYDIVLDNTASGTNNLVPSRIPLPWHPQTPEQVTEFFNTAGIGVGGEFIGWEILDGQAGRPDYRGRQPIGVNNVNQVTGGTLPTDVNYLSNPTIAVQISIGGGVGVMKHILTVSQLPAHSHAVNETPHTHSVNSPSWGAIFWDTASGGFGDFVKIVEDAPHNPTISAGATTGLTINSTGDGTPHNNIQPGIGCIWVWKK